MKWKKIEAHMRVTCYLLVFAYFFHVYFRLDVNVYG
jgi:hypothetical protein